MTAPITSARVRELSEQATPGNWRSKERSGYFEILAPADDCDWYGEPGCHAVAYADTETEQQETNAALIAALCSEPARAHIAKALDLLELVEAGDAVLVAKVAMLLDHPSVYMGGPSAQSKRKAGYLLHELAALVGEG